MDRSLPGSSVHGILQERIQECIAISFSGRSSWTRNLTWTRFPALQADSLQTEVGRKPFQQFTDFSSVQFSGSVMSDSATPCTAACQASLSITNPGSLFKLMSIESAMASNDLILCHALLLLPSIFPSIKVFSNESVLHISGQSIGVQLQHQSFQWIFRTDFL